MAWWRTFSGNSTGSLSTRPWSRFSTVCDHTSFVYLYIYLYVSTYTFVSICFFYIYIYLYYYELHYLTCLTTSATECMYVSNIFLPIKLCAAYHCIYMYSCFPRRLKFQLWINFQIKFSREYHSNIRCLWKFILSYIFLSFKGYSITIIIVINLHNWYSLFWLYDFFFRITILIMIVFINTIIGFIYIFIVY